MLDPPLELLVSRPHITLMGPERWLLLIQPQICLSNSLDGHLPPSPSDSLHSHLLQAPFAFLYAQNECPFLTFLAQASAPTVSAKMMVLLFEPPSCNGVSLWLTRKRSRRREFRKSWQSPNITRNQGSRLLRQILPGACPLHKRIPLYLSSMNGFLLLCLIL